VHDLGDLHAERDRQQECKHLDHRRRGEQPAGSAADRLRDSSRGDADTVEPQLRRSGRRDDERGAIGDASEFRHGAYDTHVGLGHRCERRRFAQTNGCPVAPATLAANATCTISVTFTPRAAGARSASVTIDDDAAESPHAVTLTGSGGTSAVAFDRDLGANSESASGKKATLTTTAAAAPGSRVFVFVNWKNASRTLASVTGGGLTWTIDRQAQDARNFHGAIASGTAPTGLAAGTVITANFSGPVTKGLIAAASFTGIASASPLDASGSNVQAGVAAWTASVTTTNANDLVLGWSGINAQATSTATAPNVEIHDVRNSAYSESATSAYRIESTPGVKAVNGTWSQPSGATANITVVAAYRAG